MLLGSYNCFVEGSSLKECLHTLSLCIYSGVHHLINQSIHFYSNSYNDSDTDPPTLSAMLCICLYLSSLFMHCSSCISFLLPFYMHIYI
jgi:hypothetical protein